MLIQKAEAVGNRRNEGYPTRHKVSKIVLTTQFYDLPLSAQLVRSKCRLWRNYVKPCVQKNKVDLYSFRFSTS